MSAKELWVMFWIEELNKIEMGVPFLTFKVAKMSAVPLLMILKWKF